MSGGASVRGAARIPGAIRGAALAAALLLTREAPAAEPVSTDPWIVQLADLVADDGVFSLDGDTLRGTLDPLFQVLSQGTPCRPKLRLRAALSGFVEGYATAPAGRTAVCPPSTESFHLEVTLPDSGALARRELEAELTARLGPPGPALRTGRASVRAWLSHGGGAARRARLTRPAAGQRGAYTLVVYSLAADAADP